MKRLVAILVAAALLPWQVQGQQIRLAVPANVKVQLQAWLSEPGGLNDELLSSVFLTNPKNTTPRTNLGNMTLVQFDTAQKQLYDFLILRDGQNIRRQDLLSTWLDVLVVLRNEYNAAWELEVNVNGTLVKRSAVRDFFNSMAVFGGRASAAPLMEPVIMARWQPRSHTQYGLPNGNSGVTNWVQCNGDGDADWFDELDEGFGTGRGSGSGPDGTTSNWHTALNPVSEAIEVTLTTVTDPTSSSGHIIRAQVGKDNEAGCNANTASGKQIDWTVTYREGGTVRATMTHSTTSQTTWQSISYTFTSGEADSCTYTTPTIRVVANGVGGGAGRDALTSAVEFETPDAGGGPPTAVKDVIQRGVIPFPR